MGGGLPHPNMCAGAHRSLMARRDTSAAAPLRRHASATPIARRTDGDDLIRGATNTITRADRSGTHDEVARAAAASHANRCAGHTFDGTPFDRDKSSGRAADAETPHYYRRRYHAADKLAATSADTTSRAVAAAITTTLGRRTQDE